ncbi:uncharacterized protein LOC114299470 [Camellia sinensis]|uniref:uncharacterized protein LOC114299470 n=1 Tax=Camellia sinensis TaxID=4442 RepID=UPI00103613C5|nr:uncharacterized protein LOC114299470 [Camellia sinensis]
MAATIPIFDGDNYQFWKVKMTTLFQSMDLWDMVERGYQDENNGENRKKNAEALSLIQRCVSDSIFKTIMNARRAKDAWDFLQEIFQTEERPILSISFLLPLAKALLVPANISKSKETNLIVATLIATVTFAAGITMPGGYVNDNKDPNQGMAILTRKAAFKAFVITDTIALTLSSFAVLTHLDTSVIDNPILLKQQLTLAFLCTAYAMLAMLVAFITGTYAVLASSSLSIFVCVIPSILLFMYLFYRKIFFPLLMYEDIQRHSSSLPRVQNQ